MIEFTFFVDAETYLMSGGELAATEDELFDAGIERVDVPTEFGHDLGERVPVRVVGTARGLQWYAGLRPLRHWLADRLFGGIEARWESSQRERLDTLSNGRSLASPAVNAATAT